MKGDVTRPQALMREQMRSTDRALSNIESHPEGFNMLRRMYENVQVRADNCGAVSISSSVIVGRPEIRSKMRYTDPITYYKCHHCVAGGCVS